jgi:hypothetical protein
MPFISSHAQFDHGKSSVLVNKGFRVLFQELIGGNAQPVFHAKDIVGRQEQTKPRATFSEA